MIQQSRVEIGVVIHGNRHVFVRGDKPTIDEAWQIAHASEPGLSINQAFIRQRWPYVDAVDLREVKWFVYTNTAQYWQVDECTKVLEHVMKRVGAVQIPSRTADALDVTDLTTVTCRSSHQP